MIRSSWARLRTFRASGIQCHVETDGRKTLDVLHERSFDLLITDSKMPNVGGDVLVRCVSQLRPELPCIVMTGLSEQDTLDFVGRSPNVVAVLRKPLNSQRLAIMSHGFCRTPVEERANFQYWRTMLGRDKKRSAPPHRNPDQSRTSPSLSLAPDSAGAAFRLHSAGTRFPSRTHPCGNPFPRNISTHRLALD
jgi:two-component system response regulator YesN